MSSQDRSSSTGVPQVDTRIDLPPLPVGIRNPDYSGREEVVKDRVFGEGRVMKETFSLNYKTLFPPQTSRPLQRVWGFSKVLQ